MRTDPPHDLQALFQLTSAALPTGAFSHSYGLETYVQDGRVSSLSSFGLYARAYLHHSLAPADGAVVALAHRAVLGEDGDGLAHLDVLLTAMKLVREGRTASLKTGHALLRVAREVFPDEALDRYAASVAAGQAQGHFAVTFGCVTATLGLSYGGVGCPGLSLDLAFEPHRGGNATGPPRTDPGTKAPA
jgi:urease accessory protein